MRILFSSCNMLAELRRNTVISNATVLCTDAVRSLLFFKSALELLQIRTAESLEEEVQNEELRIAITTGAVSVRRVRREV